MSVIGFDIGNESCVIAAAKRGGIDVLLNDEAKRETPSLVSFADNQRLFGSASSNPKTTISHIKRLIGKQFNKELALSLPFAISEGPRGGVLIELEYLKEKWTFTPVEILAMLFKHLKCVAEKNLEASVVDCVIGIPAYFTDLQRRLYLDAAGLAGLNPLRLLHDGTAIALGYGMYKTDLDGDGSGPSVVVFVDVGHCDTQVTVAAFEQGGMRILCHTFNQNLGGRDFDEVLFKHFAAQFSEKYKIDVCANARASVRLMVACEKVKKVLSANAEAPISIECLVGDTDVRGVITREEFEKLSSKLLKRITVPCKRALKDSGISVDQIYTVELVGSGSRIPAITRVLTSFFKKEPARTLNASECVARGCALRCAMLSPTLQVRDYKVEDSFPYSIVHPSPDDEFVLVPKSHPFPCTYTITCTRNLPCYFPITYSNKTDLPAGISPIVGRIRIGRAKSSDEEAMKFEFELLLNPNGIINVNSARIVEHDSYLSKFVGNRRKLNLPFSENLEVSTTHDELHEAQKKETYLAEQDMKVEQTKDQRNTLESFVYETRSKLSSAYKSFATDSEKEAIVNSLKETEDWLYEDSDDESEQDYTGKLKDLKKLLLPVENRYQENARAEAEKALRARIEKYRLLADSESVSKKKMLKTKCLQVEKWLNRFNQEHSSRSPANLSTHINNVLKDFESNCKVIMRSKPSFPAHDEHSGHDKRHQPVDSEHKEQLVDSEHKEQTVDLEHKEQPVDSEHKEQPVDSEHKEQHVESDQREQHMDSDQSMKRMDSGQREQHVDSEQREQFNQSQGDEAMESDGSEEYMGLYESEEESMELDESEEEEGWTKVMKKKKKLDGTKHMMLK